MRFVRENRQMTNKKLYYEDAANVIRSKGHRQTVQVQSVLGNFRSVHCAMQ